MTDGFKLPVIGLMLTNLQNQGSHGNMKGSEVGSCSAHVNCSWCEEDPYKEAVKGQETSKKVSDV